MPFDTTVDTTQGATRRNRRQPPAKKSAYVCRFCNIQQRLETDDIGLWLRRSRVRAPSVTLLKFLQMVGKSKKTELAGSRFTPVVHQRNVKLCLSRRIIAITTGCTSP
jgi:hypothetical protein